MRNKFFSSLSEPLLDIKTAAALLGCSIHTVIRWCEDGTLAYVTTHRGKRKLTRKIRPSTLHAFLSGNTVVRPSTPEGSGGSNLQPPLLPPIRTPGVSGGFDGMPEPPLAAHATLSPETQMQQPVPA
jgi:excisionase family DNA binding protein